MDIIKTADRMKNVHSDIRGPLFVEAMDMRARGIDVLRLNTGIRNPSAARLPGPNDRTRHLHRCGGPESGAFH